MTELVDELVEKTTVSGILAIASQWIQWDPCADTREEVSELLRLNNLAELDKRLGQRLAFGTAGLRAPMGSGYCRMNNLIFK